MTEVQGSERLYTLLTCLTFADEYELDFAWDDGVLMFGCNIAGVTHVITRTAALLFSGESRAPIMVARLHFEVAKHVNTLRRRNEGADFTESRLTHAALRSRDEQARLLAGAPLAEDAQQPSEGCHYHGLDPCKVCGFAEGWYRYAERRWLRAEGKER